MAPSKTHLSLLAAAARTSEMVTLSTGGEISVRGLTVTEFVAFISRFPALREVILSLLGLDGRTPEERADLDTRFNAMELFGDIGPEAMADFVAIGMGKAKDKPTVEALMSLGDADFFDLVMRVVELTAPNGMADFFGRVVAVLERMGLASRADAESEDQPLEDAA